MHECILLAIDMTNNFLFILFQLQSGLERSIFGNHQVTLPSVESHSPPAFTSDPLTRVPELDDINKNGEK